MLTTQTKRRKIFQIILKLILHPRYRCSQIRYCTDAKKIKNIFKNVPPPKILIKMLITLIKERLKHISKNIPLPEKVIKYPNAHNFYIIKMDKSNMNCPILMMIPFHHTDEWK